MYNNISEKNLIRNVKIIPEKEYKMATKKVLNVGKIMVLSGAVIILILVAFLCGYFLKETNKKKTSSDIPIPQTTMMANEVAPATTMEITTTATTTQTAIPETTTTMAVSGAVTNALTVTGNGEFQEYVIKLANPSLNIYSEPSYDSMVNGVITDRGSYVIVKEFTDDSGNKWGLLETDEGWINLSDARKSDPSDNTYQSVVSDDGNNSDNNNNNNFNNNNNNNNTGNGGNGGLTGVDADGDGWDDGWNPDAWCPICGYDSYYNADGSLTCSNGHTWSY